MANIAILVGNTEYRTLGSLYCCENDLHAIEDLLTATEKFESINLILNKDSAQLKNGIRGIVDAHKSIEEIFFYFTGHGFFHEAESFLCATNFDTRRPNDTGLSITELHTLLRPAEAELVVNVIDACCSGQLLIKSEGSFLPSTKQGFKNLIQIASCLDSQTSLTGNPISLFTGKFRAAALRKNEGAVYYTDIINALRDEFLDDNTHTPHFVSQGTGRELFAEDGKHFDVLRAKLLPILVNDTDASVNAPSAPEQPVNILDVLERADKKFASKQLALHFISQLFEKLTLKASEDDSFGKLFSSEVVEHSDFKEPTTRDFIIRVLSGEKRPDNFVTADIRKEYPNRGFLGMTSLAELFTDPKDVITHYELQLNCELEKVQLRITLTPKFLTLKRFVLVVSCAPSLEVCYVMEMLTQHSLRDWGSFDSEGIEVSRRWFKMNWLDPCDGLVDKIYAKLMTVVQESVDATAQALAALPSVNSTKGKVKPLLVAKG